MAGIGINELIWLALAALLGLGIVIAWIIRADMSRNALKDELRKMILRLEESDHEKIMMAEEVNAAKERAIMASGSEWQAAAGTDNMTVGKMAEKITELESENERLRKELGEARSSLEEVYKALCSK